MSRQVAEGEHHGAVQRAEDVAELLHRADDAERHAALAGAGRGRRPAPASPAPARRRRRPGGTRPATIDGRSYAAAVTSEPSAKTTSEPTSTGSRPRRSAIRPISGSTAT